MNNRSKETTVEAAMSHQRTYDLGNWEHVEVQAAIWYEMAIPPEQTDIMHDINQAIGDMLMRNCQVQAKRAGAAKVPVTVDTDLGLGGTPSWYSCLRSCQIQVVYGRRLSPANGQFGNVKSRFVISGQVGETAELHLAWHRLWEMARNNVKRLVVAELTDRFSGIEPSEIFLGCPELEINYGKCSR